MCDIRTFNSFANNNSSVNNTMEEEKKDILTYTEQVNVNCARAILMMDSNEFKNMFWDKKELDKEGKKWNLSTYCKSVRQYCGLVLKKKGILNHQYKYAVSTSNQKQGRIYVRGFGIQSLQVRLRSYMCREFTTDFDMTNAHPRILLGLCKKYELNCFRLTQYIERRNEILEENNIDKKVPLTSMNSDKWQRSMKGEMLKELDAEFKSAQAFFYKHKDFVDMFPKTLNTNNPKGSYMNKILCHYENQLLQSMMRKFDGGDGISTPMFDGFLLKNSWMEKNNADVSQVLDMLNESTRNHADPVFHRCRWEMKPHNDDVPLPTSDEIEEFNVDVFNDETECAEFIVQKIKHRIKKTENSFYLRRNHIWITGKGILTKVRSVIRGCIASSNLKIMEDNVITTVGRSDNSARQICNIAVLLFDEKYIDDDFEKQLWESNLGYLFFKNGIYSFKDKELYDFDDPLVHGVMSTMKINRDFPERVHEDIEEVQHKIFNTIFEDLEVSAQTGEVKENDTGVFFRNWCARGLAGQYKEKTFACGIGFRNSGKSLLIDCFNQAFGPYICTPSGDNLLKKGKFKDSDVYKGLMWTVELSHTRLNFLSEISTENNEGEAEVVNGVLIKILGSGGDDIKGRQLYELQKTYKLQGRFCLLCNDIPPIEPADTRKTITSLEFPVTFVKDEAEVARRRINRLGSDDIKDYVKTDRVIDAITHIILDSYTPTPLPKPLCAIETEEQQGDEALCDEDRIFDLFDVVPRKPTKTHSNFIPYNYLKDMMKKAGIRNISANKMKIILESNGCCKDKHRCNSTKHNCDHGGMFAKKKYDNQWVVYGALHNPTKDPLIEEEDSDDECDEEIMLDLNY